MSFSSAELVLIAARASNLAERLAGQFAPTGEQDASSMKRLAHWKHLIGGNGPHSLASLFPSGLASLASDEKLLPLLGPVRQPPGVALPDWVNLLDELVRAVSSESAAHPTISESTGWPARTPIPFEHLYRPITVFARARIDNMLGGNTAALTPPAWRGLQHSLLRRISTVCSVALYPAFLAYKATRESGMFSHFFHPPGERKDWSGDRRIYEGFVAEQLRDGSASFYLRYPVAARLTVTVTLFWIKFIAGFIRNLESDRRELSNLFNRGMPLGAIKSIVAGMSDPHLDGKAVLILNFVGGRTLVYKPRSLEIDRVFFDLTEELNGCSGAPDLPVLKTLGRDDYGWMEFAEHAPCRDRQAAKRFYRRAGALACLVHRLDGVDCHRENMIAAGEHPLLVDLESLAHPLRAEEQAETSLAPDRRLSDSVLRTGLLPLWLPRPSGVGRYDLSGLGAPVALRSVYPTSYWQHVNTDQMQLSSATRFQRHSDHRPHIGKRVLAVQDFERDVIQGYRQMAKLLNGRLATRLRDWRLSIRCTPRRGIKRATALYGLVLRRSLRPEFLMVGVDRSIALQALSRDEEGNEQRWEEIQSLEQMDIPYFHVTSDRYEPRSQSVWPAETLSLNGQIGVVRQSLRRKLHLHGNEIRPTGSR